MFDEPQRFIKKKSIGIWPARNFGDANKNEYKCILLKRKKGTKKM